LQRNTSGQSIGSIRGKKESSISRMLREQEITKKTEMTGESQTNTSSEVWNTVGAP
jgi:hypothetical protein